MSAECLIYARHRDSGPLTGPVVFADDSSWGRGGTSRPWTRSRSRKPRPWLGPHGWWRWGCVFVRHRGTPDELARDEEWSGAPAGDVAAFSARLREYFTNSEQQPR
ncbi:hypothetical protein C8D87_112241 [Lentzea atacamensis]|uniref:Transposase IS701-like DDE domain-containing protein n=1 Tax=Lentzea atacamensis TaxID=531938 RepID=A0ABX9DZB2_9PSEU|nr:hypothetical protein [Lentzea atacamensis]RAS60343.1 hypothetical protein C8D87_112241 [Lentzea atacamensis]